MGVLGLTPFIQKYCPEVMRELPHRLKTLSGKTIAIDGTLITQRLHFAPMPCDNRHILGWYRLIRELKASEVGVICVFDGAERGIAKQHESERRRKVQRMEAARGAMELERLRRLRRFTELYKQYQGLPQDQRDRHTKTLQRFIWEPLDSNDVIQEPPLRRDPDLDLNILKLANEPIGPDPPCSSTSTEVFLVDDSTTLQSSESSTMQTLINGDTLSRDTISWPSEGTQETKKVLPAKCTDDMTTRTPILKIEDQQQFPSPASSSNLSLNPQRTDEGVLGRLPQITQERHPLRIDAPIEPPLAVISSQDSSQNFGYIFSSTHKDVYGSSIIDPYDECFVDEDGSSGEFCEYLDSPAQRCLDSYTYVNAMQPCATEPPDDTEEVEESKTYFDFGPSDAHRSTVDKNVDDSTFQVNDVGQELLSLYENYHQSISAFISSPLLDPSVAGFSEVSDVGAREQYAMSKSQVQLTLDEGILWRSLVDPVGVDEADPWQRLDLLSRKSESLSKSYEKRNNPPTSKTYEGSKIILQALGIPCIETTGPYEAEALAASLVHHGFADYVASEDTDVLIYEVPLLRNITNRQTPLTLLSGAEIRQVLQLDRASYVDFALLLGTDFSQRIRNLGPHRAIKLIRAHGRIEHVIANEPRFAPRLPADVYLEQVATARLVFETLPPVPDPEVLQPMQSDESLVVALLDKYGVYREAMADWDFGSALDGNYFNDDPSVN